MFYRVLFLSLLLSACIAGAAQHPYSESSFITSVNADLENYPDAEFYKDLLGNGNALDNLPDIQVNSVDTLKIGDAIYQKVEIEGLNLVSEKEQFLKLIEVLKETDEIVEVFENPSIELPSFKLDPVPNLPENWHLKTIHAYEAWAFAQGAGITVAVLDTGVDYNHPKLKNNIWTNVKEVKGTPGVDDDGNGYIDDIHGWNFSFNNNDPIDKAGHGTHCSGIIGGAFKFGEKFSGVAPKVKIMPLKIIEGVKANFLFDTVKAISYALDNGARVLSNSWRLYSDWVAYIPNENAVKMLEQAIQLVEKKKAVFIVAAGNETKDINNLGAKKIYPVGFTSIDAMIGVAATDISDKIAGFSNWGATSVHVAAPGVKVFSTVPGGKFAYMSGTSMATPVVAGLAALMLNIDPNLNGGKMRLILTNNGKALKDLKGKIVSGTRINVPDTLLSTFFSKK